MLDRIDTSPQFIGNILFSDETTFYLSGFVNRHNVRIWGSQNPHVYREHIRDSPKLNVWCGLMKDRIIGPFFFGEATAYGSVYLHMLEQFLYPQVADLQPNIIFQQDGASPHWGLDVPRPLNATIQDRWTGRGGPIRWPPHSPDLTPLDFFLWVYVKDRVFVTPVNDFPDLRARILETIATVPMDMLERTWQEIEYRLDIVRATNGANVKIY
ncbi:hypothetical protein B7P43_G13583 [Cryptotermes secundus]|uniref:Tc1-like transposase DDE domain-containing protein n=1 Tax=Cryptotermes secundus TaxID=105785 RepID=A0A2J7REX7_9NEOP|nr:hypothetical protein B7P43_G13583 [Cryptotermes secundus]